MWFSSGKATASKSSVYLQLNLLSQNCICMSYHLNFHVKIGMPPSPAKLLYLHGHITFKRENLFGKISHHLDPAIRNMRVRSLNGNENSLFQFGP